MQNTMDVLPIEITQAAPANRAKASSLTGEGAGFSEAIGSAVDRAAHKPAETTDNTKTDNTTDTKENTKPMESVKDDGAEATMAEDAAASGYVDIQQIVAGLIIGLTNENEAVDTTVQEAEQPAMEMPERQQAVDVLEGLQIEGGEQEVAPTQDNENGVAAQKQQAAKDAPVDVDAEAWMPTDSSEAEKPQPAKPQAEAAVDVEREIESRLEEHLSPLENINHEEVETSPKGEMTDTYTNEVEIEVKETKDDQKSIEDIQGGRTPEFTEVVAEAGDAPESSPDEGEGQDAEEQKIPDKPRVDYPKQNEAFAVKQDVQPPKTPLDSQNQKAEETIFNRMVEDIATNAQQGKREFSINLRPDFMGDMNIELVMTEAGLSAKIKAADPQVNSMISQHLFKLEQSLKEQGIDVVNLEVSVFDTGDFSKEDFSRQHSRGDNTANNAGRIGRVKAVAREAIMAAGMETLSVSQTVETLGMGSSVEYTA